MILSLDIQCTSLDRSRSPTAGYLPRSELELRHAGMSASAAQLEMSLQAAPMEHFPENHDILEQSACQAADSGPRQCPRRFQP
jgi:hypothetical protein